MTLRYTFLVVEASEDECLLGFSFLETHKWNLMFCGIVMLLNWCISIKFFHQLASVQVSHSAVIRVFAKETAFIPWTVFSGKDPKLLNILTFPLTRLAPRRSRASFSKLQENAIQSHFIKPGKWQKINIFSTLGTVTNMLNNTLTQNTVGTTLEQKPTAITKSDLKNLLRSATPVLDESSRAVTLKLFSWFVQRWKLH